MSRVHAGAREREHQQRLQLVLDRLAANARRLRIERELSQEQLAEAAGCTPNYVQRIEGAQANTTISFVASLAHALGVDVAQLFAAEPDQSGRQPQRKTKRGTARRATASKPRRKTAS